MVQGGLWWNQPLAPCRQPGSPLLPATLALQMSAGLPTTRCCCWATSCRHASRACRPSAWHTAAGCKHGCLLKPACFVALILLLPYLYISSPPPSSTPRLTAAAYTPTCTPVHSPCSTPRRWGWLCSSGWAQPAPRHSRRGAAATTRRQSSRAPAQPRFPSDAAPDPNATWRLLAAAGTLLLQLSLSCAVWASPPGCLVLQTCFPATLSPQPLVGLSWPFCCTGLAENMP